MNATVAGETLYEAGVTASERVEECYSEPQTSIHHCAALGPRSALGRQVLMAAPGSVRAGRLGFAYPPEWWDSGGGNTSLPCYEHPTGALSHSDWVSRYCCDAAYGTREAMMSLDIKILASFDTVPAMRLRHASRRQIGGERKWAPSRRGDCAQGGGR